MTARHQDGLRRGGTSYVEGRTPWVSPREEGDVARWIPDRHDGEPPRQQAQVWSRSMSYVLADTTGFVSDRMDQRVELIELISLVSAYTWFPSSPRVLDPLNVSGVFFSQELTKDYSQ